MTTTCNKCGATYEIDPNKIIAPTVRFKCRSCGNFITIHKNEFMTCVNVAGTSFNIASTTYMDDFTDPMQRLERESRAIAKAETIKSAVLSSIIIIIIAIVLFIFGGKLTANIKYLSEMTDRISLGDLDALIEIRSKDELAVLAESISRPQQSVKLSMQRLRKK